MNPEFSKHLELLFGSIGIILATFFAVFLFLSRKTQPKANLFLAIYLLAFSLRIGKSLFHNYFELPAVLRNYFLATLLCIGPSLWLYASYVMQPQTKARIKDYIHYLPFLGLLITAWLIPNNGSLAFSFFYNGLIVHMFAYTLFTLRWVSAQKGEASLESGASTKQWLQYFLGVNLFIVIIYFLISELIIPYYLGLSFLFSFAVFFFSYWALKNPSLFKVPKEKYSRSSIGDQAAKGLVDKLKVMMDQEKPYLDPDLKLAKMSNQMGVSVKELSQVVNQIEGLNFSQFVAKYRIEEAKRLMNAPSHANFSIAAIAYDSGFNSISSFNAAFKKHTDTTPFLFRQSLEISNG